MDGGFQNSQRGDTSDADRSISTCTGTAFFNLFTIDRCCHRKYSFLKTFLTLFLLSAVLFGISYTFAEELSFRGMEVLVCTALFL